MATELNIDGTILLQKTLEFFDSDFKILVHEGSSGSSKTFSVVQALIIRSFQDRDKTYSVVRKTLPAMKRSVLRDYKVALAISESYRYFKENKTDLFFVNQGTGTVTEFFALDDEQKARGPRRDILYCNEANELGADEFRQLAMRTRGQIILDYNPSMLSSWIYDEVLTRPDCLHIHSTYKMNSFLTDENIREIEAMVPVYEEEDGTHVTDWDLTYTGTGMLIRGEPYWWSVYGLGVRGAPSEAIFPYVFSSEGLPDDERVYGLDFGYNHPAVLVEVGREEGSMLTDAHHGLQDMLHIDELIHESYLTIDDLINKMDAIGVSKDQVIYADGSRPEAIEEIKRAGYWIQGADKTKGSVYAGINFVKSHKLCFTDRSQRGKMQHQDYRWIKKPDGSILDEPVKMNDDSCDAVRYAAFTHWGKGEACLIGVW